MNFTRRGFHLALTEGVPSIARRTCEPPTLGQICREPVRVITLENAHDATGPPPCGGRALTKMFVMYAVISSCVSIVFEIP